MDDLKASRWGTPPPQLLLGDDEVHVWRAKLNARAVEVEQMIELLSRVERREMQRSDAPKHLAAARHMVRTLLGRYLGRDPGKLKLKSAPDGRLFLAGDGALHFDLAASGGRALFAISATQRVAVSIDALPSADDIARRMRDVPAREARQLEFLSPQNRAHAVIGHQLERACTERLAAAGGEPGSRIERLKVGGSFAAALSADGWDWSPSFWRYLRPGERAASEEDEEG